MEDFSSPSTLADIKKQFPFRSPFFWYVVSIVPYENIKFTPPVGPEIFHNVFLRLNRWWSIYLLVLLVKIVCRSTWCSLFFYSSLPQKITCTHTHNLWKTNREDHFFVSQAPKIKIWFSSLKIPIWEKIIDFLFLFFWNFQLIFVDEEKKTIAKELQFNRGVTIL